MAATDSSSPSDDTKPPPLHRDVRSPGMWPYFSGYLLLLCACVIILVQTIQSGLYLQLGTPCLMILLALLCLSAGRKLERNDTAA